MVTASTRAIEGLPDDASVVALRDAAGLPPLLAQHEALVVVSDGFEPDQLAIMAVAISTSGTPVIEVKAQRWDGESPSPVSAACRGVISGFGDAGVAAAVRMLQSQPTRQL